MTIRSPSADRVVVCMLDGLRPDMVTPALTPNLCSATFCDCDFAQGSAPGSYGQ